jgi:hypothetical protein
MGKMVLNRSENFSGKEKIIAKSGLCAAIPTAVAYALYQAFPENPLIAAVFASVGALTLIAGLLCLLIKPAEIATRKVKKLADWSRMYSGRVLKDCRRLKQFFSYVFGAQRNTCQPRNNDRAHRSASHPTFGSSSKGNSDDGDSDPGDQPGPSYPVTPISSRGKKLNSLSLAWRFLRCHGSRRVRCGKNVTRRWTA